MRLLAILLATSLPVIAAEVTFTPKELFQIPFGNDKNQLLPKQDGDQLRLPHEFTIDGLGRFYITDVGKSRVARFSPIGAYEMGASYPATVRQVFAHADEGGNLWLLIAEPTRGIYYGVYDPKGKPLRTAAFEKFNKFRLHVADDGQVRALLSSDKSPKEEHTYLFDAESFLMKPDKKGKPPEGHHQIRDQADRTVLVDAIPGSSNLTRLTDPQSQRTQDIQGRVIYITDGGDIYTRVSEREIRVYRGDGALKGKVRLIGLSALAANVRFDAQGNIYQMDGIPDRTSEEARKLKDDPRKDPEDRLYSSNIPGMRLIKWERR